MPTPDTELQSRARELLSLCNGASGMFNIIMEEMAEEFRNEPEKTLYAAEKEYRKRVTKTMKDLGRPESPITLFYSFREHNIQEDQVLINQMKDMKDNVPELYAEVIAKVGLTVDSPVEEVARAVRTAAKELEDASSK